MFQDALNFLHNSAVAKWVVALLVFGLGVAVAGFLARITGKYVGKRSGEHVENIWKKIVFFGILVLVFLASLNILGFQVTTLLAAAGVFGIAIGFAAQTSIANIISGLFLLFEQPFRVGDAIQVGDTMGMVLSIDLLSVKLRKFDNLYIRVPNESVIKSNVTNFTRYDIRRFDLNIGIAYGENIREAVEILENVVEEHPMVLKKPDPQIIVDTLADSSVNIIARVWFDRTEFIAAKSDVITEMKMSLDEAGIEIPFPHRTHYASDELLEAINSRGKTKKSKKKIKKRDKKPGPAEDDNADTGKKD